MFKKWVAILCAGVMALSLAGCGGGGSDQSETDTAQTEDSSGDSSSEDSSSDEEVTISIMWQQEVTEAFWDLPLEQFAEKYPNVKVEFESNPDASSVIRNLLNVQEAPDIFYSWISEVDYYSFAEEGLLYSVDDILQADNAEGTGTLGETIFSSGLELGEIDGSHYFLPTSKLIAGSFYSGKLFEDNGWTAPETWDEFMSLCGDISESGITPYIYAGTYPYMLSDAFLVPMIHNLDAAAIEAINENTEGAWTQDAVVEAVQRLQDMRDAGYIDKNSLAMDHIQSQSDFINNNDAFVPSGSWLEGEMEDSWPADFDLQPIFAPSEESGSGTSTTAIVECMVLPKKEDDSKLEYITELLKLFYSEENQKYVAENTGFLLATEEAADGVMEALPASVQTMWNMVDEQNIEILTPTYKVRYKELLTELNNNINALIQEEIDADEFCSRMDAKAQEISSGE